jgi:hypothetical protein
MPRWLCERKRRMSSTSGNWPSTSTPSKVRPSTRERASKVRCSCACATGSTPSGGRATGRCSDRSTVTGQSTTSNVPERTRTGGRSPLGQAPESPTQAVRPPQSGRFRRARRRGNSFRQGRRRSADRRAPPGGPRSPDASNRWCESRLCGRRRRRRARVTAVLVDRRGRHARRRPRPATAAPRVLRFHPDAIADDEEPRTAQVVDPDDFADCAVVRDSDYPG